MKLEYRPIAVQNECFGGTKHDPEIFVLVKMEAQGKRKKLYKYECLSFPRRDYLDDYLKTNKLPVIPEKDFRAGLGAQVRLLAEASSK